MQPNRQRPLQLAVCVAVGLALCAACIADEVTISGTVLTPDGRPAAGAKVVARWLAIRAGKPDARAQTTSGEDGTFSLGAVLDSKMHKRGTVLAFQDGFGLGWQSIGTEDMADCAIALNTEAPLKGDVRTDDGTPISGAEIKAEYVSGETFRDTVFPKEDMSTTSDGAGAFALGGLPAGRSARISVTASGYARMRWNPAALGEDGLLHITLQPEAVIAGTVTRDGQPVAGVRVGAVETNASEGSRKDDGGAEAPGGADAVSDDAGRYRIEGLCEGEYNVCLDLGDDPEWTTVAHEGLKCTPGSVTESVDFTLIRGGFVTGIVTNAATGEPMADRWVACYGPARPMSQGWCESTRTDAEGRYRFRLPPGQNRVYTAGGGSLVEPEERMVEVVEGETNTGVDFGVTPATAIDCVVLDQEGQPVSGGTVRFLDLGMMFMPESPLKLDEMGRLRTSVPPSTPMEEVMVTAADSTRIGVGMLHPKANMLTVEMNVVAAVTGRVVDADGNGLAGARVHWQRIQGTALRVTDVYDMPGYANTDADGRFTVEGLPAKMPIRVQMTDSEASYIRETEWPEELTLEPAETRDVGNAVVDLKGLTLKGRTMDAERNPLAGCRIMEVSSKSQAASRDDGTFELPGLPFRGYGLLVLAMHPDQPLFCIETNADPTVDRALDLVLEPLGSVCGRLLDAQGQPLRGWRVGVQVEYAPLADERDYAEAYGRGARIHTWVETDANGAWRVDGIVCGSTWWASTYDPAEPARPRFWHETFAPRAGETVDFGNVTVK